MRTIRSELQAKLNSGTASLIDCAKITRKDGVTIYMADYPVDIVIGGNLYKSTSGYRGSAANSNAALSPDTIDIQFILGADVTKADITAGLFDGAEVRTFTTDADDPLEDDIKMTRGFFGNAVIMDNTIKTEYISLISKMDQQVGQQTSSKCRAELGDSRCRVKMTPPVWTPATVMVPRQIGDAAVGSVVVPTTPNGYYYFASTIELTGYTPDPYSPPGSTAHIEPTWPVGVGEFVDDGYVKWSAIQAHIVDFVVLGSTSRRIFLANTTQADGFWDYGTVRFTSGLNAGYSKEIKQQLGGGIELFESLPYEISEDDEFTMTRGCQKRVEDCAYLFSNIFNYRGEPYTPTKSEIMRFGGQ